MSRIPQNLKEDVIGDLRTIILAYKNLRRKLSLGNEYYAIGLKDHFGDFIPSPMITIRPSSLDIMIGALESEIAKLEEE